MEGLNVDKRSEGDFETFISGFPEEDNYNILNDTKQAKKILKKLESK